MSPEVGDDVDGAVDRLERDGIVGYPTDTLYALGARMDRPVAIARIFRIKERPGGMPLTLAVDRPEAMAPLARVTPLAERLFEWLPGPLTIVLERTHRVPENVTAGASSVGLRVPDEPTARRLAHSVGPLTATSANVHDGPPAIDSTEAVSRLGDRVDYYLASHTRPHGTASTIVDCRGDVPIILREGVVRADEIRARLRR